MAVGQIASTDRSPRPWVRHLWAIAQRVTRSALDLCFPPRCVVCGDEVTTEDDVAMLCTMCRAAVTPPHGPGCPRCGAFAPADTQDGKCLYCRDFCLAFDTVVPLGLYEGTLREHVLAMKHPAATAVAEALACLLFSHRAEELVACRADVIVPVPMFWSRRLHRATNSAETIATALGRQLGLPAQIGRVWRHRRTPPQNNLRPRARFRNVRGAFSVHKPLEVKGLRVMVVDDVLTTGATASEVAKTLKAAGADYVAIAVVARAQGPDRM